MDAQPTPESNIGAAARLRSAAGALVHLRRWCYAWAVNFGAVALCESCVGGSTAPVTVVAACLVCPACVYGQFISSRAPGVPLPTPHTPGRCSMPRRGPGKARAGVFSTLEPGLLKLRYPHRRVSKLVSVS